MDTIYRVNFLGQDGQLGAQPGAAPAANTGAPAPAAAQRGSGCGGPEQIIFMLAMLVVFYFLLIRPQQKKMKQHKSMVDSLQRGNEVITSGGIFGRIVAVEGNVLTVEIAKNTHIRILKSSVGGIANTATEEKLAKDPQPGSNS